MKPIDVVIIAVLLSAGVGLLGGCASQPKELPCLEDKPTYTAQEKYDYLMGCRTLCSDR